MITREDIERAFTDPVEYRLCSWRDETGHRRPTLSEIKQRVESTLASHTSALAERDAEIARLRAGIKRLSDEEEKLAETTDGEEFSLVSIAAQLASAEGVNKRLLELLKKIEWWAKQRCPCDNDEPNPCPLCGASVENLEACKAVESIFPRDLLADVRAALSGKTRRTADSVFPSQEEIHHLAKLALEEMQREATTDPAAWIASYERVIMSYRRLALAKQQEADIANERVYRPEEISQSEALNLGIGGRGVVE